MDNTTAGRIKLLTDLQVKVGEPATLQNGWKGHVTRIDGAYVWIRVPSKKNVYKCAPWAVDRIKQAMRMNSEKEATNSPIRPEES